MADTTKIEWADSTAKPRSPTKIVAVFDPACNARVRCQFYGKRAEIPAIRRGKRLRAFFDVCNAIDDRLDVLFGQGTGLAQLPDEDPEGLASCALHYDSPFRYALSIRTPPIPRNRHPRELSPSLNKFLKAFRENSFGGAA